MESEKVILDTNLWISFLISKKTNPLEKLIGSGKIRLIFSNELVEEFVEVVTRPKFKKYFSSKDIEKILSYFSYFGLLVEVNTQVEICRDLKDNFLLNLAIDSEADYLITGDQDLLVLKKIRKTKILTLSNFIERKKLR